jgi:hypothetical protein
VGAGGGKRGDGLLFFGDPKKLNLPLAGGGVTGRGGGGGGAFALNWATMCGSRLTLKVNVNSSLLCSILKAIHVSLSKVTERKHTYNSNSCSTLQSRPNLQSGVVTKCMPLFNVQAMVVGCCGKGTLIHFRPRTVCGIRTIISQPQKPHLSQTVCRAPSQDVPVSDTP